MRRTRPARTTRRPNATGPSRTARFTRARRASTNSLTAGARCAWGSSPGRASMLPKRKPGAVKTGEKRSTASKSVRARDAQVEDVFASTERGDWRTAGVAAAARQGSRPRTARKSASRLRSRRRSMHRPRRSRRDRRRRPADSSRHRPRRTLRRGHLRVARQVVVAAPLSSKKSTMTIRPGRRRSRSSRSGTPTSCSSPRLFSTSRSA